MTTSVRETTTVKVSITVDVWRLDPNSWQAMFGETIGEGVTKDEAVDSLMENLAEAEQR